ncbi:unnamed protein product [Linum tenue]|uniref:GPI inositol-deacylase n=1 Tax=Linum tenue TaxID=586396 RepID=A0AAV0MIP7_9ROSI|nr:unnamed protein product [Linum tenue]
MMMVDEAGKVPGGDESGAPLLQEDAALNNDSVATPQLFTTSLPTLNEATDYLTQTTSLITRCFPSVDFSTGDYGYSAPPQQELATISRAHAEQSAVDTATSVPSTSTSTPPSVDRVTRSSSQGQSGNAGAIVPSSYGGLNGISIFQGLIERARRTVRGSADDIGWLQCAPGMPPVEDGTERFMEILDSIRHGVHRLPKSMVYLLVPGIYSMQKDVSVMKYGVGFYALLWTFIFYDMQQSSLKVSILDLPIFRAGLFSNHGPLYFVNTKQFFSKIGLTCHIAKIHSEASVEKNAKEIYEYIEEMYWGSNKRVMLLGHSKGGIDAAAALSLYWPNLQDKVAGLVLIQSPYGGSPIASDILREGQLGDYVNVRKLMEIIICKVIKGDMQALEDLTYEKRRDFLTKYPLPEEVAVVSFHTEASVSPAVLATLSRVAHAELPVVAPLSTGQPTKLPVVMPLGAAMAACAQLLQVRYGEKSDGLVTRRDAEVPGSVVVRPARKLDHAWMVYSSLNDDPSEADASQVCEALLELLVEVGQKRRHEIEKKQE